MLEESLRLSNDFIHLKSLGLMDETSFCFHTEKKKTSK